MSPDVNLDPVETITTGAVGEPGNRTFYLQARSGARTVSLLVEKEQVAALAMHITELLRRLSETRPVDAPAETVDASRLSLEEPIVPEFRVGPMALGYDAERDLVLLRCQEFIESEDEDTDDEEEGEPVEMDPLDRELREIVEEAAPPGAVAQFWATREQMRALAERGVEVVAAGRPLCPRCGHAMDPSGHVCPYGSNGHRELGNR